MRHDATWLTTSIGQRGLRDEFFAAAASLATVEAELLRLWMNRRQEQADQALVSASQALERFGTALRQYARGRLEGLPSLMRNGLLAQRFYPNRDRLTDTEARAAGSLVERKLGVIAAMSDFARAIHLVIDSEVDHELSRVRALGTNVVTRTVLTLDEALEESGKELDLIDRALEACEHTTGTVNSFLIASEYWFRGNHQLPGSWGMLNNYFQFPDLEEEWRDIRTTTWMNYKDSEAP